MPKVSTSDRFKCQAVVKNFSGEFQLTPDGGLYCKLCACVVDGTRKSSVDKHRQTAKHQRKLEIQPYSIDQGFISRPKESLIDQVTNAFLSADIPLKKLRNPEIRKLFEFMGHSPPSESACRSRVFSMADKELQVTADKLSNSEVFLVADESDVNGVKYFVVLAGDVLFPEKTFLVHCRPVEAVESQIVTQSIDDAIRVLNVQRKMVVLMLSDAASYMVSAGKMLKNLYPNLFHVTCVAHLLHNCAEKVRFKFPSVDNLIARVKASTIKNRDRRNLFSSIGYPPQPVITRWASWLNAAFYYAENLPKVREIISEFEGSGLLVARVKEAIADESLASDLAAIQRNYMNLAELVFKVEKQSYTVEEAFSDLNRLSFGDDSSLKNYLIKRMDKNCDLRNIMEFKRQDITPALYVKLQQCQATSVSVERCFSQLNKLLAKDRNFNEENVEKYMRMYYNKSN